MKCASKMTMSMMRMARASSRRSKSCGPMARTASDLIDKLHEMGNFKSLRTALDAADLTGALRGTGPFTLFAPTDKAFAKLPAGTVEALLKDIPKLKKILPRHVVAGLWKPEEWMQTISVKTLDGQPIRIAVEDGNVTVEDASVTHASITAANGLIHVIDAVLVVK
jgi:uncharacterized surface protein with fasciclin (FAS1) repeats